MANNYNLPSCSMLPNPEGLRIRIQEYALATDMANDYTLQTGYARTLGNTALGVDNHTYQILESEPSSGTVIKCQTKFALELF